ncbi:PREDICTED: uncharacterized protein LOC105144506 isoform X1 [Acromyrmex echinatior]|uniref:uncharacterized protein LOC105144506 isoform X1 n=1 Tax=Acromyrmex echinatior TaxID=103372 RepID=UPI000580E092|nr:PREDICTED: uncharacterized protein LOC105144506 isoform X1 [Acromyrmex echinatior]
MCLYCALGEFLVAQCNEIYYAAYSNEWYSVNSKITQDLLLLLIRGAKPIHLTAGKIFPMTMMTFCRPFPDAWEHTIRMGAFPNSMINLQLFIRKCLKFLKI